jgi:hypothetical protein
MVSPRKRVLQASHAPGSTARAKPPTPFSSFRFFIDLKSKGAKTTSLIEDINALGGQLEEFFSKSVTHLITDCPEERLPSTSSRPIVSAGPPSPWTPSPVTSASPASTRRPLASSRTESILAKVKQPNKSVEVTSTLPDKAAQLGIQIWSLTKTIIWLAKFRAKYGSLSQVRNGEQRPRSAVKGVRVLASPCIKLESTTHCTRPVYAELKVWPSLHLDGRPGSSPFSVPSARQKTKKLARRLDIKREPTLLKKKEENQTKARKTGGFCEICNTSYPDLERHLITDLHTGFVTAPENWAELDQLVTGTSSALL